MSWITLTEDEADDHLDKPFNPPPAGSDEDAFVDEWSEVRNQLEEILSNFGEPDAYGDKDFYVGQTTNFSRGIGVCLTSDKMITPLLIPAVQRFLRI